MRDFPFEYLQYKELIDRGLRKLVDEGDRKPRSLLGPLRYVFSGGGKRIRPILLLIAYQAVGGKSVRFKKGESRRHTERRLSRALDAALAVEALHNFTLVHDDIMDNASSRRGRATVHMMWDENTAILLGDELIALAYHSLLKEKSPRLSEMLQVFTEGVLDVCEGQAFDKEFQFRIDVTLGEYLKMIEKKTGRMVAVALEIGAIAGNGTSTDVDALRSYGFHLGRAFQIQDDLLDLTGDNRLGKKIGGDLIEGKKTYLLLKVLQVAREDDRRTLEQVMRGRGLRVREIDEVRKIYEKYGVVESARKEIRKNIMKARRALKPVGPSRAKEMLSWVGEMLQDRRF